MGPKPALEAIILTTRAQRECLVSPELPCGRRPHPAERPYEPRASSNELMNHLAEHIGKSEITPLKTVSQPLMVEAQKSQYRSVQIMDMHLVHRSVEAEVVRLPQSHAGTNPAAGHPHGETIRMMVTTVISALNHRRPAEFAAPDHQSVVQQTPGLEVLDQRGVGSVGVGTVALQIAR